MDNFLQVIDQRVKKTIVESNVINTTPCIVLNQVDSNNFSVKMLSNDSTYTVPNLSGSVLQKGDLCQVFYKGSLSQRNCFIGAALNRQDSGSTIAQCINFNIVGDLPTIDFMPLANCKVLSFADSPSLLNINMNVQGLVQTEFGLQILINGEIYKTIYKNINEDEKEIISVSFPLKFEANQKYKIQLNVKGMVTLLDFECFVYGFNIEETVIFDPTTDDDYIIDANNNSIIYYIGNSTNPQIPLIIQNTEINKIYSTGFNYSTIESVYIPEGIEEIE